MSLKLYERYPQLWESPSNDYPQGAFKNLSAQGETDGSYLEKDWLNDYSGFFGALLRNAEMTPNGEVDTAKKSQFYDALVAVTKKAVGEEGYRKLDDNIFNDYLQVRSEHEGQETGVFLQGTDGTVRGSLVYNSHGMQIIQTQEYGSTQLFTFPIYGEGGEIALTSYVDDKIGDIDTSNLVPKDDITNELGDSTELVASQALVSSQVLGYGQSWVDVRASRVTNTTYTNNTGKPIFVLVSVINSESEKQTSIVVDGLIVGTTAVSASGATGVVPAIRVATSFIVPDKSSYRVDVSNSSVMNWAELR